MPEPAVLLLSTSDTDLITARSSGAKYRWANPSRLVDGELGDMLRDADIVVVRILGGYRAWQDGIDEVVASGVPAVVVSGEQSPDAELMGHSTTPAGVALQSHVYLAHGGVSNLRNLHAFLCDTLLMTGFGFSPPESTPNWGVVHRNGGRDGGPTVAVLYYRAQHLAGNIAYVEALCDAIEGAGGRALPVFCASLRTADAELLDLLGTADALVTTVLAAGGATPSTAAAGGADDTWNVAHLAALDIPILQGLCLTSSRAQWQNNHDGLSPLDVATQVAVPEFDGRIITVPFSFKEIDDEGLISYVPDPERCARVAGLAVRHARLRAIPIADKRVAVVFSAYPTKHARIGNAVGLDTPASAVALLRAMREHGYRIDGIPGVDAGDGDALIHALIERGGQDPDWLTEGQLEGNPIRVSAKDYREWFATLSPELTDAIVEQWGPPPGKMFVDRSADPDGEIVIAALQAGNVVLMVQPPRGFGENPVSIYHDPDLPPSHHYLAAYRWIESVFGADAVVHLGKHGNLEWLPGKTLGMSAGCGSDAALGNLPLIYPFLVNDPGEGTQAKRRAHATLVDHLIPPMARAETYGDIARLEQLLDEHANVAALDPGKLPAIRQQIWTLMRAAKMDHDLGLEERPEEDSFDDMLLHVDGWLCEIKDVQIRDGLHILSETPTGEDELDLVLAVLRARQLFGGEHTVPGLRQALGLKEDGDDERTAVDAAETQARGLVAALQDSGWNSGCGRHADRQRRRRRGAPVRRHRSGAQAGGHRGGDPADPAGARRALHRGRPVGLAAARPRQRAAHRAQLLLGRPQGGAVAAGVGNRCGDGGFAAGPLPRRLRRLAAVGRPVGVGHLGDADRRRRYRRSACAAGCPAGLGRRVAAGGRPRTDHARRARPAAHRRHRAHLGLLPRRLPARRHDARRRGRARRGSRRTGPRTTTSARTREPTSPSTAIERRSTTRIFGSQAGNLRCGSAAADRQPQLARRRRPRRGVHRVGRIRLRPRPGRGARSRRHEPAVPADRGGRQEHRHPRTRHRRLRRLLPVPRRHDRHRARADRQGARRLHRRQHPPRRRPHPHPVARRPRGCSAPAWSTRAG